MLKFSLVLIKLFQVLSSFIKYFNFFQVSCNMRLFGTSGVLVELKVDRIFSFALTNLFPKGVKHFIHSMRWEIFLTQRGGKTFLTYLHFSILFLSKLIFYSTIFETQFWYYFPDWAFILFQQSVLFVWIQVWHGRKHESKKRKIMQTHWFSKQASNWEE